MEILLYNHVYKLNPLCIVHESHCLEMYSLNGVGILRTWYSHLTPEPSHHLHAMRLFLYPMLLSPAPTHAVLYHLLSCTLLPTHIVMYVYSYSVAHVHEVGLLGFFK